MKCNSDDDTEHPQVKKLAEEFEIKKDPDGVRVINGTRYIGMITEDEWLEYCKKRDKEFYFTKIAIWLGVVLLRFGLVLAIIFLLSWLTKILS